MAAGLLALSFIELWVTRDCTSDTIEGGQRGVDLKQPNPELSGKADLSGDRQLAWVGEPVVIHFAAVGGHVGVGAIAEGVLQAGGRSLVPVKAEV